MDEITNIRKSGKTYLCDMGPYLGIEYFGPISPKQAVRLAAEEKKRQQEDEDLEKEFAGEEQKEEEIWREMEKNP
jgi:hypothetical protein